MAPETSPRAPAPRQHANEGPSLPAAPSQVPVDGGLGWLAAAGAAYAANRLRKQSTTAEED